MLHSNLVLKAITKELNINERQVQYAIGGTKNKELKEALLESRKHTNRKYHRLHDGGRNVQYIKEKNDKLQNGCFPSKRSPCE